jgi:hypothetical protein
MTGGVAKSRGLRPYYECARQVGHTHSQGQNLEWATAVPSPTLYKIYLRWQYLLVEGCPYW